METALCYCLAPRIFIIFKESEETNIRKRNAWLYLNCYTGLISLLKLCNVIFYRLTTVIQVILLIFTLINNATTNTFLHVSELHVFSIVTRQSPKSSIAS